jgi:hypothetical protein
VDISSKSFEAFAVGSALVALLGVEAPSCAFRSVRNNAPVTNQVRKVREATSRRKHKVERS